MGHTALGAVLLCKQSEVLWKRYRRSKGMILEAAGDGWTVTSGAVCDLVMLSTVATIEGRCSSATGIDNVSQVEACFFARRCHSMVQVRSATVGTLVSDCWPKLGQTTNSCCKFAV